MKAQVWLLTAAASWLGCTGITASQQAAPSVPERLTVTIEAQQTAEPISKYLYGGFIEHIGTLIYRSLWSEMIDDRKFYFPISSKNTEHPITHRPDRAGCLSGSGVLSVLTKP
jgi:hypothetical protein